MLHKVLEVCGGGASKINLNISTLPALSFYFPSSS